MSNSLVTDADLFVEARPDAIDTAEDLPAYEDVKDDLNVLDEAENEAQSPTRFRITSYGADLSVFDLRRRLGNEILIPAPFQRKYVWTQRQASRFIESLLLGLPVPGIFVYVKDKKQLIVDGQQRLLTLDRFLSGTWESGVRKQGGREVSVTTPFSLQDVDSTWEGKTFEELDGDDRADLENYLIHATIFRQDVPRERDRSIYEVFERINTGGLRLSAQEIRACVSHGEFSIWLGRAAELGDWQAVYGRRSPRLKDEELILRFLAMLERSHSYKRPMRVFLDDFLEDNRDIRPEKAAAYEEIVLRTLKIFRSSLGSLAFRPANALNAAVFDAAMVGCARRLESGDLTDMASFRAAYDDLLANEEFKKYYVRATADDESVKNRIRLATAAFSSLN